jgi:hypothetical protein
LVGFKVWCDESVPRDIAYIARDLVEKIVLLRVRVRN